MTYRFYILAGQSNMEGMGAVEELPENMKRVRSHALIYHPNRQKDEEPTDGFGRWQKLGPGHGKGHHVDAVRDYPSRCFGPELSFADRIRELRPKEPIALFKYAKGGSSIHAGIPDDWGSWDPAFSGINQWTHFEYHYRRALLLASRATGLLLEPSGIVWIQGESDAAYTAEIASRYLDNLKRVIHHIRELAGDATLPVVIVRISEEGRHMGEPALPHVSLVQQAQHQFVKQDPEATLVEVPPGHGWIDPWHYDSPTYLELGKRVAEAMDHLSKK